MPPKTKSNIFVFGEAEKRCLAVRARNQCIWLSYNSHCAEASSIELSRKIGHYLICVIIFRGDDCKDNAPFIFHVLLDKSLDKLGFVRGLLLAARVEQAWEINQG